MNNEAKQCLHDCYSPNRGTPVHTEHTVQYTRYNTVLYTQNIQNKVQYSTVHTGHTIRAFTMYITVYAVHIVQYIQYTQCYEDDSTRPVTALITFHKLYSNVPPTSQEHHVRTCLEE